MSITSLAHACIKTTDLGKISKFYCDTLGMKKQFNFTKNGKVIGFYMQASKNSFVEVFETNNPPPADSNSCLSHFCLETDSIEEMRQRLVDAGYNPGQIKMGADNSYQFWIKDPNGMDMEFHQYTPESSQTTGKDVEVDW